MVQNKLPLINSAHGPETRNIINELIKLFNGMGYTYNEALQKAKDVLNEAERTNRLNNNTNSRLDRIIADSGTSSTEVVDARGNHVVLNSRLETSEAELKNNTDYNLNGYYRQYLKTLLDSGEGIRMAILGDSTEAGVGNSGATAYGEVNNITTRYSGQSLFGVNLIVSDPKFISVKKDVFDVTPPRTAPLHAPIDSHQLVYSNKPSFTYDFKQDPNDVRSQITIYYLERTNSTAATLDATIKVGSATEKHTIDSYTPPLNFGNNDYNVAQRVASKTINIPDSAEEFTIDFNNVNIMTREGVAPTNGTFALLGFTFGKGVLFKNYAVSSTTLKNDSSANISRGVTTSERLQKAYDMDANVITMGFGTNDSKSGVSTVEDFIQDYKNRIDEIRDYKPSCLIILNTDPKGVAGSDYENNLIFNEAIRNIALEKNVLLLDIERIFKGHITSRVYADDVHPNDLGYRVINHALCDLFGVSKDNNTVITQSDTPDGGDSGDVVHPSNKYNVKIIPSSKKNDTGTLELVDELIINTPSDRLLLQLDTKINVVSTSDNVDVRFELRVEGFDGENATGTSSGESFKDRSIISLLGSGSSLRMSTVTLKGIHYGTAASYKVKLYGANYQLRSGSAQSVLIATLIG